MPYSAEPVESTLVMDEPTVQNPDTGLSNEQWRRIDQTLRRLHEAMREFLIAWPVASRTPSKLSRELGVDRTTCQRLTSLAKDRFAGTAMLESVPGPRAMRNIIDATEQRGGAASAQTLQRLRAAVDGFDELTQSVGGSLSRLKRRVAASQAAHLRPPSDNADAHDDADLHARRSLFDAARHITGRQSQSVASVGLYDAVDVDAGELRHVRISANLGVIAQPHAVPMILEAFDARDESDDDSPWQRTPMLIPEFTSADWSTVELEPSPGFASRAMEITRQQEPTDVAVYTAFPVPDPTTLDNPIEESWYVLYNPAAALVFDLYLHESIARRCLLSLDIHLWQTSFANHPHGKWHTRLPQSPPIVQLGRGLSVAASKLSPRQQALTESLFDRANADPDEYVGYRCEQHFPIWRTGYRFELDFGRPE